MKEKLRNTYQHTRRWITGNHWQEHIPQKKAFSIITLTLIAIGIPVTVFISRQQQDIRQEAAQKDDVVVCDAISGVSAKKPDANKAKDIALQTEQAGKALVTEAKNYKNLPTKEKNKRKKALKDVAQKRKELLIKTMRHNPDAAYDLIQYDSEEATVNTTTQDCSGKLSTVEGDVTVWHTDFSDNTAVNQYYVGLGKNAVEIYPTGSFQDRLQSGMKIKVHGYKLDNNIVFDARDLEALQIINSGQSTTRRSVVPKAYAAIPAAIGDQKTIVIIFNTPNKPSLTASTDTIRDAIFVKANNFFKENSYGKTSFSGDVYGPYMVTGDFTCQPFMGLGEAENNAMQAANTDGADFTKYTRMIFVGYTDCPYSTGSSTIGQSLTNTPDGQIVMSAAKVRDRPTPTTYEGYSHELGHSLGLLHASAYDCGFTTLASEGCGVTEYGDSYDRMGSGNYHFNVLHKDILGWFNPNEITTVNTSGTFTLLPIATSSPGLKGLKIPRSVNAANNIGYLSVEYRQPIGIDNHPELSPVNTLYKGALLHLGDRIIPLGDTYLLDATPPFNRQTPTIPLNGSFTDPQTGTTITVTGISPAGLTVAVTVNAKEPTASPTEKPNINKEKKKKKNKKKKKKNNGGGGNNNNNKKK